MVPFKWGLKSVFWSGCRDQTLTATACHIRSRRGQVGQRWQEFYWGVLVFFPLKPPWAPSQQLLHLSWWSASTVCSLGPGPPMLKGQCWLSWGSCVEYPCITVTVPLIYMCHWTVSHAFCLWAVSCQTFLQYVLPTSAGLTSPWLRLKAFQLRKRHQYWEPCLARLFSSGSVGDTAAVGQSDISVSDMDTISHIHLAELIWQQHCIPCTWGPAWCSSARHNLSVDQRQSWLFSSRFLILFVSVIKQRF